MPAGGNQVKEDSGATTAFLRDGRILGPMLK